MTPADLCKAHPVVGLDANVFIYLFEDGDLAPTAGELLDALHASEGRAVLSALGVAEILTGPAMREQPAMAERYLDELRALEILSLLPVTPEIAADAAAMRADRHRTLADTIHLATARAFGATAFVTNDRRIKSTPRVEVVSLAHLS